jgi:hypothetical protein
MMLPQRTYKPASYKQAIPSREEAPPQPPAHASAQPTSSPETLSKTKKELCNETDNLIALLKNTFFSKAELRPAWPDRPPLII